MDRAPRPLIDNGGSSTLLRAISRPEAPCVPCGPCQVRPLAICSALTSEELSSLANIVSPTGLAPRQPLFDERGAATLFFFVTAGAMKIYKLLPDGRRQITGFLFASDFLGLAQTSTYAYSAEAITRTDVCRFRRKEFEDLLDRFPRLEKKLLGVANDELAAAQEQMLLLGRKSARERIASFLLALNEKAARCGRSSNPVWIPMNRSDIGDYLGLSTETVSRTFTELKLARILALESNSKIRLLDLDVIESIADGNGA